MGDDICIFCGLPVEQVNGSWQHVNGPEGETCPESGLPTEPFQ